MHSALLESLARASAYPHPTRDIHLVETHISWIFLTGDFAYKLKKPLDLGFLDFSTLEKRRHYCEDELRLNRRFVPELYLGVVEIRGTPEEPRVGELDAPGATEPAGELLEYALRMRQFDRNHQLDIELEAGTLGADDMGALAETVATAHAGAARVEDEATWGDLQHVLDPIQANFPFVRAADPAEAWQSRVDALQAYASQEGARLASLFEARKAGGFVRECHGDLHLSNLVRLEAGFRAFDCIEFSAELRWIDVASDLAFLVMDLQVRGRDDLAFQLVDEYLELTGDFEATRLLDFYLAYRSLVRAKVAAVRLDDPELPDDARASARARLEQHVNFAERQGRRRPRGVVMMNGLSGSGKSWLARQLLAPLEAFRVRSDVERKRLRGLARTARTGSDADAGIYTPRDTEKTYARLAGIASTIVSGGHAAIVDATFLTRRQRTSFIEALHAEPACRCVVIDCHAPEDLLEARVAERAATGRDASEANAAILQRQLETRDPVEAGEVDIIIRVDTTNPVDLDRIVEEIVAAFESAAD
jgi:aminoglycoside phosphotransferase family enzyme/predicted kinase